MADVEFTAEDGERHTYSIAMPLGAFDEIAKVEPRLRIVMQELQGATCDFRLARHIGAIGLKYGNGPTVEDFYRRHGWLELQRLALEILVAGLPRGNAGAARGETADPAATSSE